MRLSYTVYDIFYQYTHLCVVSPINESLFRILSLIVWITNLGYQCPKTIAPVYNIDIRTADTTRVVAEISIVILYLLLHLG